MAGRTSLGLAARAGLSLTPDVRLALDLLHLAAPELRARVEREVAENPLLEMEDEAAETVGEDLDGPGPGLPDARAARQAETTAQDEADGEDPVAMSDAWNTPGAALPRGMREVHTAELPEWPGEASLGEHLRSQFRLESRDPVVQGAGDYLVGCLDGRGYLGVTPDVAARDAGLPVAAMEEALAILRTLDPPGVGARDLQDCLLLQLRARGREGSLAWRLVAERFRELMAGRRERSARGLGLGPVAVTRALAEIRTLRPHPGRLVGGGPVRYIYPDLSVRRIDGEWLVQADDRTVPRVRCAAWGREWARAEADPAARAAGRERLVAARCLVRALERRRGTLLRVMECILEEQEEFFEHGAASLRPMTLRMLAGRLGLHESTVARVVRCKHVATPRGLLPLRYFFSGALRTEQGPHTSSRAVKARIGAMVAEEHEDRPLSDTALASRLASEGIRVARRTVAKYRASMRIERAQRRRAPAGPRVRPRARDDRRRRGPGSSS